ncbi:hypothetical protein I8751_06690 [Nostocaceae cyanobacterium CENA357]|uniref:Uncharacterized protein n=1 Tax=Atlanticothrix silvestris CENA357 TaxID=1725252 RepID=A0A8J7HFQ6_9CYAN|nr:hypothetical protein [Atlanticothrix silvestris]MBH8552064.1 hypothetical protein [Atlanticothrix silvestris CENA357]
MEPTSAQNFGNTKRQKASSHSPKLEGFSLPNFSEPVRVRNKRPPQSKIRILKGVEAHYKTYPKVKIPKSL